MLIHILFPHPQSVYIISYLNYIDYALAAIVTKSSLP